ncbi:P-loop containing nucleoside triphosphate hydrolase protein [Mycena galopus ATCC 62051]|nr:P-loop containing nucleoside triphosphate hydrolase protein [Mycena galopus ATCC 62051]
MSAAISSSARASRPPPGGAELDSVSAESESAAIHRPDPILNKRIPSGVLGPSTKSHVLILEGGRGGAGGPGGVQAQGDGGSGGTGEGAKVYITAQNVTNMHPSPAVVQASQVFNHCPPPSRNFQGQQQILKTMHQFFAENTGRQHIYVLYGLGGAGKTQIALKFMDGSISFTDKLLVDASSIETIETGLKAIATAKEIGNSSQEALKWLATRDQQWLLFFDNADDPKLDLNKFFPKCNHGNIIITSRNPNLRVYGAHSQVSDMDEADAVALLLKSAAQETSLPNELLAAKIVQVLWYLPLAIVQAGAFILESGSLDTYLALYPKNQAKLLSEKPTLSHDDYAWTAYTTWQMSFDRLSPPAAMFLQLCSFLHRDGISEDIFSRASHYLIQHEDEYKPKKLQQLKAKFKMVWSQSGVSSKSKTQNPREFLSLFLGPNGEWESTSFVKLTKEIMAYSLINFDAERKSFSMHPLVHEWSRTTLIDPDPAHSCMGAILGMSITEISEVDIQLGSLRLVSHIDTLMQLRPTEICSFTPQYASIYFHVGRYTAARELQEAVLQKQENRLGNDHWDTLEAMHWLAMTYIHLGQFQEAKKLKLVVLEKWRKCFGDEHPKTLRAINNLASTYQSLGQFQEAEKLQLVVLEKQRKLLGDDHLDTLWVMNNLANTYRSLGQVEKAEKLQLVVLEKRRKLLGDDHLDTLLAMNNLAATHVDVGLFEEGERLHVQVLDKRRRALGEEHAETIQSMNNLGHTYYCLGQLENAEELQVVAVKKQRKLFGDNHPESQRYVRNLAQTYRKLDKQTEAEELEKLLMSNGRGGI